MHRCGILFFILLLASCHVGEEYNERKILPEGEVKSALKLSDEHGEISTNWYMIFKDDVLNTLLDNIINCNLSIKQAEERLIQARYTLKIQSRKLLPTLDMQGSYKYQKSNSVSLVSEDADYFRLGFDAVWEMDFWGKGDYITEQYAQMMKKAEYSLLNIKASISAEVVSNYIQLRMAQEKLRIANKNLQLQMDILKTIKDKHEVGIADDLSLNQAEYVVETTKAVIPNLKATIETYKNTIAVLLGVSLNKIPVNLDNYKTNITADTFKYSVKNLYNLPLDVIHNRPDIKVAESSIRSQNAVVNQAITELYPSVNLGTTFGYISFSGRKLFNNDNQVYGYNPQLTQPIWYWKQLVNNIDLQKHVKEEYVLNYNNALLTALAEVKNSIVSIEQSYTANQHKKKALTKMQNILQLTQEKYKNGLVNFTDVADAEKQLLTAQTDYVSSNAEILLALVSFYKAIGGGYNLK